MTHDDKFWSYYPLPDTHDFRVDLDDDQTLWQPIVTKEVWLHPTDEQLINLIKQSKEEE